MVELGQRKGYTLVAHTGNMFFVADEIVAKLSLPSEDLGDVDRLFSGEWVNVTPWKRFCHKLKNVTPQRLLLKLENAIHEGWPRRE